MNILKIIHVGPRLSYSGGIEKYIQLLCEVRNSINFEISVCTFYKENEVEIIKKITGMGAQVYELDESFFEKLSNKYLKYILKNFTLAYYFKFLSLKRIISESNPDIIIAHGEDAELISGFLDNNLLKINVVHGESFFPLNIFYRLLLYGLSRRKYHHTIFVSEVLASKFYNSSSSFSVIKSGIKLEKFENQIKKNRGSLITIGFLGRLSKEKGLYRLLEAFKILANMHENVCMRIAGTGAEKTKLKRYLKQLYLDDKVEFLGEVINPIDFYRTIDVFVLSSYTEGFPLTILEAMASGLLVIATNVGGVSKIVKNHYNGLLIKNNSPKFIVDALYKAVTNYENMNNLRENAILTAREYSAEKFIKDFYNSISESYKKWR